MLSRIWPAILSLTIPWLPENCSYGGGGDAGAAGSSVAGRAGAGGEAGTSGEGTTGTSGASSAGTSGEGTAGTGVQPGSFTFSPSSLYFSGICEAISRSSTITNTSSVPLTWHVTGVPSIVFTPASSTLAPGESVDVTVTVSAIDRRLLWLATVSIDADVAPSQTVEVTVSFSGQYHSTLPADLDFGDVPIPSSSSPSPGPFPPSAPPGAPNTRFIPADPFVISELLGSDNPAFSPGGVGTVSYVPGFGMGWLLVFAPQTLGPQEATFTFGSYNKAVCPPNTFKARGVGVAP